MRYITLKQAAQQLNIEEGRLLQGAQAGYLTPYILLKDNQTSPRKAAQKYLHTAHTVQRRQSLYFRADDIEELAEDLQWSRLGLQSLAYDEDSESR